VFIQRSNYEHDFLFIQATEKDDHANANHLYDTAGAGLVSFPVDRKQVILKTILSSQVSNCTDTDNVKAKS